MGEILTAEQVKNEAIAAMGSPLGEIYHSLGNEVSWLHLKWNDFKELFADKEIVDTLNSTAPVFFHDLQRLVWEDILLHLCRVADPTKSAGKSNLTIRCFPDLVLEAQLRVELQKLVDDADEKIKFARDWRNRRLAHRELSLNGIAQPLALASFRNVETALQAIRKVMNLLEHNLLNKTVSYEEPIPALGGVPSLLAVIRKGLAEDKRYNE